MPPHESTIGLAPDLDEVEVAVQVVAWHPSPSRSLFAKICHARATAATRRQNALVLRAMGSVKLGERPMCVFDRIMAWVDGRTCVDLDHQLARSGGFVGVGGARFALTALLIISFLAVPAVPNRVLSPSTRSNGNVCFRTIRQSTTAERH